MFRKLSFSLLLFLFPVSVFASHVPAPTGHVNDFASVLTTDQKETLETQLKDYEIKTSNEIAVLTVKSLDGQNIDEFGIKAFEEWKIGKKGKDNGVLLTVAINDRKMRIDVGYGLESQLTDSKSGDIIRNVISPEFKKGEYYSGIASGILAIERTIAGISSPVPTSSWLSNINKFGSLGVTGLIVVWIFGSLLVYFSSFLARSKSFWLGGVIGIIIGIVISSAIAAIIFGLLGLLLDWLLSQNYQKLKASGKSTSWWDSGGGFFSGGSGGGGGFGGGGFSGGGGGFGGGGFSGRF